MPSPTSKGKLRWASRGRIAVLGVVALMVIIYGTTFIMQVQACDKAITSIHSAYEKKLHVLRNAFDQYKKDHPGTKRRKRRHVDLDDMVVELQEESAEVNICLCTTSFRLYLFV